LVNCANAPRGLVGLGSDPNSGGKPILPHRYPPPHLSQYAPAIIPHQFESHPWFVALQNPQPITLSLTICRFASIAQGGAFESVGQSIKKNNLSTKYTKSTKEMLPDIAFFCLFSWLSCISWTMFSRFLSDQHF
jgi:hypothetical protein